MNYIAQAFRHCNSLQVVIPKPLRKEMGWDFKTVFIINKISPDTITLTDIHTWAKKTEKPKEGNK